MLKGFRSPGGSLASTSFETDVYDDVIAGATGGSPTVAGSHAYKAIEFDVLASGDAEIPQLAGFAIRTGTTLFLNPNQGNADPTMVWGYNVESIAGLKHVPTESSVYHVIESNFQASGINQAEVYTTCRRKTENPGNELRPYTLNYDKDNHKIYGHSLMAPHESGGAYFGFRKPNDSGFIDAGTDFFRIGWSVDNGGAYQGLWYSGNTTRDVLLTFIANGAQNCKIWLGASGTEGSFKLFTASTTVARVDVGSSSNGFQWAFNDGGMSVGINTTNNLNGLSVKPMSNAYATIRAWALAGQTLPVFQAYSSGDAQTAGVYGETGAILSKSTGGIGYETGAGGTVTQATSRTTSVTLNKTTGQITLFNAAGSTTAASFTVNNSLVGVNDVVVINQKSGSNKYVILITAVAAGSFQITQYTTGGTTAEQPVFSFAIIKGASA